MKSPSVFGEKFFFWAGLVIFTSLYIIFYPPIFAFRDEASYLSMAYLLKKGKIFIDQAAVPFQSWIVSRGHKVFDYPLGMPFLLLPFTLLGWKAVFAAGLISHLAGTFYFGRILKLFKIENPSLSLLYLFYPAFIFYSRTLMSDIPAAVLILIGVYYYLRADYPGWKAGVFFSVSLLLRPGGIIYILPFLVRGILKDLQSSKGKDCFLFAASQAFSLCLIGFSQYFFYGSVFLSGYSMKFSNYHNFSALNFAGNFAHYAAAFMLCWPFMIAAPAAALKTRRAEFLAAILSGFIFFSYYSFYDHFQNELQAAVLGVRFLFPASAFFLLMYAEVLDSIIKKISASGRALLTLSLFGGAVAAAFFINTRHQGALNEQSAMKDAIYSSTGEDSVIIYDTRSAELMQEAWGKRGYIDWRDGERTLSDFLSHADFKKEIYIVTRGARPGKLDLSWVSWDEMDKIQKDFDIRLKAKHGELEVYQFYARH